MPRERPEARPGDYFPGITPTETLPIAWPGNSPIATALLVRAGTVYWIGADVPVSYSDGGLPPPVGCLTSGGTTTCRVEGPPASAWIGGNGTSLFSATPGSDPKVLLPSGLAPGPSPVSAVDGGIEQPGVNPSINAIALSPDGSTLYFAAGTRLYSIPSTGANGAGDVKYVGFTEWLERAIPTALAADDANLYFSSYDNGTIQITSLSTMCNTDAAANYLCPVRLAQDQAGLDLDTLVLRGNGICWANRENVLEGDVPSQEGNRSRAPSPSTARTSTGRRPAATSVT